MFELLVLGMAAFGVLGILVGILGWVLRAAADLIDLANEGARDD
jgi:hypothetical protein